MSLITRRRALAWCALALLCCGTRAGNFENAKGITELTDSTFEAKTQASSATGPRWLILFYAPWCGACKHYAPFFKKAAEKCGGEAGGAYFGAVNSPQNPFVHKRFKINKGGFPSFRLLEHGLTYEERPPASVEKICDYAKEGYAKTESIPTPAAPTLMHFLRHHATVVRRDLVVLRREKKNVLVATFVLGALCGWLFLGALLRGAAHLRVADVILISAVIIGVTQLRS